MKQVRASLLVGWWGPPMTPCRIAAKSPAHGTSYRLRPFTLSVLHTALLCVCLLACLYNRLDGTGRIMFVNERLNIIVGQLPVEATYKVGSGPCSRHHSTSDGVEDVVWWWCWLPPFTVL